MALTPAQLRAANEQRQPKQITITASGALICPARNPVLELTAGSAYNITDLSVANTKADGLTIEVRVAAGSSTLTFTETGNIKTTSTSLALAAEDTAKFRYRAANSTWYQIWTTNH